MKRDLGETDARLYAKYQRLVGPRPNGILVM